mmetsp:Transcript_20908/g.55870  ORF Transcript_20908/g.55870 Transcript_20908/m.55870 type:complete len:218 (+) Transcript_20908:890-1543(+)
MPFSSPLAVFDDSWDRSFREAANAARKMLKVLLKVFVEILEVLILAGEHLVLAVRTLLGVAEHHHNNSVRKEHVDVRADVFLEDVARRRIDGHRATGVFHRGRRHPVEVRRGALVQFRVKEVELLTGRAVADLRVLHQRGMDKARARLLRAGHHNGREAVDLVRAVDRATDLSVRSANGRGAHRAAGSSLQAWGIGRAQIFLDVNGDGFEMFRLRVI